MYPLVLGYGQNTLSTYGWERRGPTIAKKKENGNKIHLLQNRVADPVISKVINLSQNICYLRLNVV